MEECRTPTEGPECHVEEPGPYSVSLEVVKPGSMEPHVSGCLHPCESNLFSFFFKVRFKQLKMCNKTTHSNVLCGHCSTLETTDIIYAAG